MCYGIEEDGERTNFVTNGWSVFTELVAEWKPTKRLVRGYGIVASEECGHEVEESITTEPTAFNRYHFYHQNEHGDTEYITGRDGKVKNPYTNNGEQYEETQYKQLMKQKMVRILVIKITGIVFLMVIIKMMLLLLQ